MQAGLARVSGDPSHADWHLQQEVQAADGGLHDALILRLQLAQQLRQAARRQDRRHAILQLVCQAAHRCCCLRQFKVGETLFYASAV